MADAPFTLPCGATVPNRVAKVSMSEILACRSGEPSKALVRLYERWGKEGKAGILFTGNVMVDGQRFGEPRNAVLEDERHLGTWKDLAAKAKAGGSRVIMQISHPGRQCSLPMLDPVGPSAVPIDLPGFKSRIPRVLTVPEIHNIIGQYARTAELAVKAGFDGVQIHAAHGYLLSQFLSPIANVRNDEYGGDAQRRLRLLLEVVRETRKRIGPSVILSVKLNSADFQKGGFSEEDSLDVIAALEKEGIDLLEISGGNYEAPAFAGYVKPSTQRREAYFLEFAQKARKITKIPLLLTGGVRTLSFANEVIRNNEVDFVGIARPFAYYLDAGARFFRGEDISNYPTPAPLSSRAGTAITNLLYCQWLMAQHGADAKIEVPNTYLLLLQSSLLSTWATFTQYPENDWKHAVVIGIIIILLYRRFRR